MKKLLALALFVVALPAAAQIYGLRVHDHSSTGQGGATLNGTTLGSPIVTGANGITINGTTSGTLSLRVPAIAGSSVVTFPAGTTDFTATGGASQFLKQASAGGALTVARPACADLSNAAASCSTDATNASNISSGTLPNARYYASMTAGSSSSTSLSTSPLTAGGGTIATAAGETYVLETFFDILNNSGATRAYTLGVNFGSISLTASASDSIAASATNRATHWVKAMCTVVSTSLTNCHAVVVSSTPSAAGTMAPASVTSTTFSGVATSASNLTGSASFTVQVLSAANTATQTITLNGWSIQKWNASF